MGSLYVDRLKTPIEANINLVDRKRPNTNREFSSNSDKPKILQSTYRQSTY